MNRWAGKVAVVTGASSGIGAAIVEELVKNGMTVVGIARRVEKIEEIRKRLENEAKPKEGTNALLEFQYVKENLGNLGKAKKIVKSDPKKWGKLIAVRADVSVEDDILKTFEWIRQNLGQIHVLVNNAGICRFGKMVDGETEYWREVINVNVLGLSICTREAVKLMRETGVDNGHIIHINSIAGHAVPNTPGEPMFSVYPASKHAVTALTETVRQELRFLKSKIRITSISPGYVETEIMHATAKSSNVQFSPEMANMFQTMPSLKAKDIADSVVYVLSTPERVQIHELTIKPVGEAF